MLPTIAIILLVLVLLLQLSNNTIKNQKTKYVMRSLMNTLFLASLVLVAVYQLKLPNIKISEPLENKNSELVVLTMDKCGYCTKLKSEILPKLKSISNLKVTVIGDKHSDFKKLSKEYGAGGFPHAHINGENIIGYMPVDKYVEKVKSLM